MNIGLIGKNIDYSISPFIHNYWFKYYNIKAFYNKLDFSNKILSKQYILDLLKNNYIGFNITIPYKGYIMQLFNTNNKIINSIKAANTLYIKNNQIFLSNTDYLGFIVSLILYKTNNKFYQNNEVNIKKIIRNFNLKNYYKKLYIFKNNCNALILGAGGSAKAIIYALMRCNINKIFVLNRSVKKALQLYNLFNKKILIIEELNSINNINLIVNCTPLESNIYVDNNFNQYLEKDCLFFDLTYNPARTEFLNRADKEGYKIINGLLMLIIQAAFSFEKWFNFFPKIDKTLIELANNHLDNI